VHVRATGRTASSAHRRERRDVDAAARQDLEDRAVAGRAEEHRVLRAAGSIYF